MHTEKEKTIQSIQQFSELRALIGGVFFQQIVLRSDEFQNLALEFIHSVESATRDDLCKAAGIEDTHSPDFRAFTWLEMIIHQNREWREQLREELMREAASKADGGQQVH